jgi:hypothetical protein
LVLGWAYMKSVTNVGRSVKARNQGVEYKACFSECECAQCILYDSDL